jgi:signal transduction histidine kinase
VLNISPETTARVRAEQALESERARLAAIVRIAPAFMAVLRGPDHVIALTNAGYDALAGGRPVLGRTVAEALPEAAAQGFVALLDRVLATGEPFVGREVAYRRPDAQGDEDVRYVDFVYQALTEADGTRSGVFVHGVDVTDQVRARGQVERLLAESQAVNMQLGEQRLELELTNRLLQSQAAELESQAHALHAAERRARFLADLGQALQPVAEPDSVMETTARLLGEHLGADRCAYAEVEADEDTFTITGNYTRGDTRSIVGRFTFRVFGAEVLRLMRANAPYVVDDADADPRVTPADRAAYEATQIRAVICVPLQKAGRFVAAMAVHQQVPRPWTPEEVELVVTVVQRCWEALERARALRRLRESEAALRAASAQLAERTAAAEAAQRAAEEANRAKTAFLSAMSHELRTPLNAIGGYAELLALGVRGPVTDAQRADLERLLRANQHMGGLVTTVLDFARIEAGQIDYHLEAVRLGPVVQDLEALVGPQLAAKGLAYDHDGCGPETPDRPHVVRADPEKLRQVLLNLLTNAVKFTEPPGRVALLCEHDAAAGVIRIRVTDSGRGIPTEQLERIFEPFVQIDRQRTQASQQGVGLGLAISRDLARGMNGDLTAESTPGIGSTFTLTLPAG